MDQTGAFRAEIYERAVGLNTNNLALDDHIRLDLFPFEGERFDHGQFDAIFFDATNPDVNRLSFFHNIFHFVYCFLLEL